MYRSLGKGLQGEMKCGRSQILEHAIQEWQQHIPWGLWKVLLPLAWSYYRWLTNADILSSKVVVNYQGATSKHFETKCETLMSKVRTYIEKSRFAVLLSLIFCLPDHAVSLEEDAIGMVSSTSNNRNETVSSWCDATSSATLYDIFFLCRGQGI